MFTGETPFEGLPEFVGRIPPAKAFEVHRGTVMGALIQALRLTYPTVESLVGSAFFDRMALDFIAENPPAVANLGAYGDALPGFLRGFAPVSGLRYLPDVAMLDLAIDRVQREPRGDPLRLRIDADIIMTAAAGLRLLPLEFPADEIRAAIDAEDVDALGLIDLSPARRWMVVWRAPNGSSLRKLGDAPGLFLESLLQGHSSDEAFAAAVADGGEPHLAMAAIQAEIFAAPFASIIVTEGSQP